MNPPRNEISKSAKYYFWDVGVRNAIINNFAPVEKCAGTVAGVAFAASVAVVAAVVRSLKTKRFKVAIRWRIHLRIRRFDIGHKTFHP